MRDIILNDYDTDGELRVHMILGITQKLKHQRERERARIGLPGEPITELTKLGWYTVSLGKENDITNILFSQTSIHNYQKLCSLDCSGVSERQDKPNVYKKFREQLGRGSAGYYETNFIWKENYPPLTNNESSSLGRINNLIRNLNCSKCLEAYDKVMQDPIREGIVERVTESEKIVDIQKSEKVFYFPHRPVIRESAESNKLRIVHDASAKSSKSTASLN